MELLVNSHCIDVDSDAVGIAGHCRQLQYLRITLFTGSTLS
jgi:hypothetical protein